MSNNPVWFVDVNGADTTLYSKISGALVDVKRSDSRKTPIWVVDTEADSYDSDNPWATAQPLQYQVGASSERGGLTGRSFRENHPLANIGTTAGSQVYVEDLLDMTSEFNGIVDRGEPEFKALRGPSLRILAFRNLVTDDAKYDLKSLNVDDGTPSYAATVIGKWSLYNNTLRRYDDYGNISYGTFGLYAGFNKTQLLLSSNINQWGKDMFGGTSGTGDEQRDIDMIKLGFRLHFERVTSGWTKPKR
jgi:hypothetical protein